MFRRALYVLGAPVGATLPAQLLNQNPASSSRCQKRCLLGKVDVVVIGGGIAGLSAAFHLSCKSCCVALLERRNCLDGATGLSCAIIESLGFGDGSNPAAQLAATTMDILQRLQAEGHDCGLVQSGTLEVIQSAPEVDWATKEAAHRKKHGYETSILSSSEVHQIEPSLENSPVLGAMYSTQGGYADPGLTARVLQASAKVNGALIHEHCQLLSVRRLAGGVWELHTSEGLFQCNHVVLCPGAWVNEVALLFGIKVPVVKMKAQMFVAEAASENPPHPPLSHAILSASSHSFWESVHTLDAAKGIPNGLTCDCSGNRLCHHVYGRPAHQEGYVYFGGDKLHLVDGVDDHDVDEAALQSNFREVCRLFPSLQFDFEELSAWAGVLGPTLEGGTPLVGEVAFRPGLWLCTGFGGLGFMQGIASGSAVASWIAAESFQSIGDDEFRAIRVATDPSARVRPAGMPFA